MQYKPSKRPIRRADEDDEDDEGSGGKAFKVKFVPIATAYKAFVNQPFTDSRQFEDLVEILDSAHPGDVVEIKLTTPGGSLQAVIPLLAAMASTQAQVYVHAVSDVASAGTFLLMMADDVFINPYVTVMFHQVTFGAYGPGHMVGDRVNHVMKSSAQLLRDLYQDFLTEDEISNMLSGKEFWMEKDEFDARFAARNTKRDAELAAAVQPQPEPAKRQRKAKAAQE